MTVIGVCGGILAVVAAVLVIHRDYEDGFFGRICLGGVFLAGLVMVLKEGFEGATYEAPAEFQVLAVCLAGFGCRHLYRFLRWQRTGAGEWKRQEDPEATTPEGTVAFSRNLPEDSNA